MSKNPEFSHIAVVVGLHNNGLGVVRALARKGVPVIAIDENLKTSFAATKYGEKIQCDNFAKEGLIDTLCDIGERFQEKGVLFLTMDRSVILVSEHRNILEKYYLFNMPNKEVVDLLMNKGVFQEYATVHGFSMPKTYKMVDTESLYQCSNTIKYPCIMKPQIKTIDFVKNTPAKAFRIKDADELISTYRLISQWEKEAVVQEWIPGPDSNLIFCLYYFNASSEPLAWFTGRKIRQYIPYCGTACFAEKYHDDFVREDGIRLFRQLNYRGFGAIEYKKDERDGSYKLIEPTVGRTEHLFALATASGVNIPYIAYCDLVGIECNSSSLNSRNIKYIYWARDFKAVRHYMKKGELTVWEWLSSLRGKKEYALFAWDDLGPIKHRFREKFFGLSRKIKKFPKRISGPIKATSTIIFPRYFRANCEIVRDLLRVKYPVSDNDRHIIAALNWIKAAQDVNANGGVARGYCIKPYSSYEKGWESDYPETTGYIIPTMFDCYHKYHDETLKYRAIRMADWECDIQLPDGGIQGGVLGEQAIPVVFNTGQVIFGWCRTFVETKDEKYLISAEKAAKFLVETQDSDGAWRKYSTLEGNMAAHAYDVRTAWSLLEVYHLTKREIYKMSAIRNIEYTLNLQLENGWLRNNCLQEKNNNQPLLHTIAYAMEGILEAGIYLSNKDYIAKTRKPADALIKLQKKDGSLAGRFDCNWRSTVEWRCLTGLAQTSLVWLKLYQITGGVKYLQAAKKANHFLKSTQNLRSKNEGIRGGIKGSYPIYGRYGKYQYLNWAAKFFIDALLLEEQIAENFKNIYG